VSRDDGYSPKSALTTHDNFLSGVAVVLELTLDLRQVKQPREVSLLVDCADGKVTELRLTLSIRHIGGIGE